MTMLDPAPVDEPDHDHDETPPEPDAEPSVRLSVREMQVLVRISYGNGNRAIGESLGVTEDTIKTVVARLFRKLDVPDRAAAVRAGFEAGLLTPHQPDPDHQPVVVAADWQAKERAREQEVQTDTRALTVRHIGACYAAMSCPCREGSTWQYQPTIGEVDR